ncbi:MAG: sigma-54-dependent Fis family transcriptional regulator [Acidobacteria bacterium]|nr:sigma-54-dependent Fis family transcriptional regulator [Acidobacteriota bacterium]
MRETDKGAVLIVDDEEVMQDVLRTILTEEGYRVETAGAAGRGFELLQEGLYDLVLLDLMLPDIDGLEALEGIKKIDESVVVIIITAYASIEKAVRATKLGAFDFIAKPFKNEEVLLTVKNGLQKRRLQAENLQLKRSFRQQYAFENIIGQSEGMQSVFKLVRQIAPSRSTALIVGESGTGKELIAKAIHGCSPRADRHFVPVNCGNIPADLLESELFGHVKGAFTGALSAKKGLFEVADGGSIFLDEVGIVNLETQAKLLRVIQEREFRRLGAIESIKVDVRIIAASNLSLQKAVEEGKFREDLFYRLNVININLPPLRERREDIPILAEHFLKQFCEENHKPLCRLNPEALTELMAYDWPGNVRELENIIERAVVMLTDSDVIMTSLFPKEFLLRAGQGHSRTVIPSAGISLKDRVSEFERDLLLTALEQTGWNQKRAAQLLGLNPTTLNEKLKRLNIREARSEQNNASG